MLSVASCEKSIEPADPAEEGKGTIDICVSGLMGEYTQVDGTKAELVNTVRVSWKGGETVYVYDGTQCLGTLKASLDGTEDRYALLSTDGSTHKVSTPADGTTTLTLVYSPLLTEVPTVSGGAISVSLASQSGAKAPFVAYATLNYTSTTITNAVVPFKFATSVIKVNCIGLKAKTAIDKATLSNVNTVCKLTLSGTGAPTVSGVTNGTITRAGDSYFAAGKVNSEGEAVFQIAVPVLETASGARVLTITQGLDNFEDMNFTKNPLPVATSVNTVCQIGGLPEDALPGVFTVSDNGTPNDPSDDKKVHFSKGNLYYDGSNWGFEDEQYYFRTYCDGTNNGGKCDANGYNNTSGTASGHWGLFGWSTNTLYGMRTSYTTSDYYGSFIDWGKTINNKGTWSTLSGGSNGEWKYLLDGRMVNNGTGEGKSYKRATITLNETTGVYGLILYPDNYTAQKAATNYSLADWTTMEQDGCVFLPAAGRRAGSGVSRVGGNGYYWSSTAYDGDSAYRVDFCSSYVRPDDRGYRDDGYSVRLITEVK